MIIMNLKINIIPSYDLLFWLKKYWIRIKNNHQKIEWLNGFLQL